MNGRSFKMLMDTLRRARRIDGMMPQLPPDLTNGRTRVLDTLYELGGYAKEDASRRRAVRVSDIADDMGATRPGVTRMVCDLERDGYLHKSASPTDGREVLVELTEHGLATHRVWYEEVYEYTALLLGEAGVTEHDIEVTVRTVKRLLEVVGEAALTRWQNERLGRKAAACGSAEE